MVKCIQLHYTKILSKLLIRQKLLKNEFSQRQPTNIVNKITKSWDKKKIRDLEHDGPKQVRDFLSWLLSSKTILPKTMLSS